ncbi:hypothetical protein ACFXJM_37515 [Streptomyces massasporeus]
MSRTNNPSSTYPTKSDKKLPGGSALTPLHRLVPGFGLNEQARYDANRSVVSSMQQHRRSGPAHGGSS